MTSEVFYCIEIDKLKSKIHQETSRNILESCRNLRYAFRALAMRGNKKAIFFPRSLQSDDEILTTTHVLHKLYRTDVLARAQKCQPARASSGTTKVKTRWNIIVRFPRLSRPVAVVCAGFGAAQW